MCSKRDETCMHIEKGSFEDVLFVTSPTRIGLDPSLETRAPHTDAYKSYSNRLLCRNFPSPPET